MLVWGTGGEAESGEDTPVVGKEGRRAFQPLWHRTEEEIRRTLGRGGAFLFGFPSPRASRSSWGEEEIRSRFPTCVGANGAAQGHAAYRKSPNAATVAGPVLGSGGFQSRLLEAFRRARLWSAGDPL